jgi:hypothetical protein
MAKPWPGARQAPQFRKEKDKADGIAVIEFRRGACMIEEPADVVSVINVFGRARKALLSSKWRSKAASSRG